jgi:hypothetical protein
MSFILDQASSYRWPVEFDVPGDGGRRVRQSFDAEFHRIDQERVEEIVRCIRRREALEEAGREIPDELDGYDAINIARSLLAGWSGIAGADGVDVPFTDATVSRVLGTPTVAAMIVSAWAESITGAKRKNSSAPRGIG